MNIILHARPPPSSRLHITAIDAAGLHYDMEAIATRLSPGWSPQALSSSLGAGAGFSAGLGWAGISF